MLFVLPFYLFTTLLNLHAGALCCTGQYFRWHISRKIHQVLCKGCKILLIRTRRPAQLCHDASFFTQFWFKHLYQSSNRWAPAASVPSSSIAFSVASGISPFSKLLVIAKICRPWKVENKSTVSFFKHIAYPPKSFLPGLNPDCLKESVSGSDLHLSTAATIFSPNGVPELHATATSEVERQTL